MIPDQSVWDVYNHYFHYVPIYQQKELWSFAVYCEHADDHRKYRIGSFSLVEKNRNANKDK